MVHYEVTPNAIQCLQIQHGRFKPLYVLGIVLKLDILFSTKR
jgi:hypothetical protein